MVFCYVPRNMDIWLHIESIQRTRELIQYENIVVAVKEWIPIIKIRRFHNRLIFIMRIPILVIERLYNESAQAVEMTGPYKEVQMWWKMKWRVCYWCLWSYVAQVLYFKIMFVKVSDST